MSVSKFIRFEVFKRDSFKCQYCGRSAPDVVLEVDHIHPESKGGETTLLNLITACFDCNRGKRDIPLADNAAMAKQRTQLEELQKRREQLAMMVEWQKGLASLDNETVVAFCNFWNSQVDSPAYALDLRDKPEIIRLIRQFNFKELSAAVIPAIETYGSKNAFSKLGAICAVLKKSAEYGGSKVVQQGYYIRGILRNKFPEEYSRYHPKVLFRIILNAAAAGVSLKKIKQLAMISNDFSDFMCDLNAEESICTGQRGVQNNA